ncbi:hypothetical protein RSAG8_02313, partial [Rhizoctonia solani AG-8 WAC10335]
MEQTPGGAHTRIYGLGRIRQIKISVRPHQLAKLTTPWMYRNASTRVSAVGLQLTGQVHQFDFVATVSIRTTEITNSDGF